MEVVRSWPAGAALLFVAACSGLQGLSGGTSDAAAVDGTTGVDGATSGDGATGADAPAPAPDAGTDSETAGDAEAGAITDAGVDAPPFCASNPGHSFCDDFDHPDALGNWSIMLTDAGGAAVDAATGNVTSPPNAMLVTVGPTTAGNAGAAANAQLATFNRHAILRFSMYVEKTVSSPPVSMAAVNASGAGCSYQITFAADASGNASVIEFSPKSPTFFVRHNATLQLGLQKWVRVVLDVDMGANQAVNVTFDGANALTTAITPQCTGALAGAIALGVSVEPIIPDGWHVRYDDVLVDTP